MTWQFTPAILLLLVAAAITGWLAVYAWRHRATRGAAPFAVMMAAVTEWCALGALQMSSADLAGKLLWSKLEYPGIVSVPVAWLAFALDYTGHERWLTRRVVARLAVVPLLTLLVVATNEYHGLFWRELSLTSGPFVAMRTVRGPWYFVNVAYAYALLFAGTVIAVPRLLRAPAVYRRQAMALLAGLGMPWVCNAVFVFGPWRMPHDPTPFSLALTGLVFAFGLFRFGLLDVVPVARDAVIEGMADGMVVVDAAGRVVDVNPAARRILSEDAAGRLASEVFARWPELVARYATREGQEEVTVGEGEGVRHYDLRISALTDARGRPSGRLIVWHDVTERKRTESELRARKQLFENLLAVAQATSAWPTLGATLRNALEVASKLTGAEGASLFVLDEAGAVSHSFVVAGRAPIEHRPEFVEAVMEKGVAGWVVRSREAVLIADTRNDERWLRLDDQGFPARSVLSVPVSSGATLVGVLTLVHTEPERFGQADLEFIQAAAAQVALAVRNAQIFDARSRLADRQTMLYEVLKAVGEKLDPEAVARVAVEAIAQHTGWPNVAIALPGADELHWSFQGVSCHPMQIGQLPLGSGIIGRCYASGRTQLVPDVAADPDYVPGLPVIRSELAVPIRRGDRVLGVLNLESDAPAAFGPEEVRLAESLADAVALALDSARLYRDLASKHERLKALEKMRDDLTHTMVHDLRNPLTSVSGVLEALQLTAAASLSENQRGMLRIALSGAERMANLIDAILEVSRLEAGAVPLSLQSLGVGPLVEDALKLQATLAADKELQLASDVPPSCPPAWADPTLVGRVLQNLVGNAVKFTPKGGAIHISAAVDSSQPAMVRVSVTDTGPGVPAELRGRLFQKFVTGRDGKGSGLGLAFCRLAVEAQGGRIWVESEPGHGSTFSFTLPAAA